MGVRKNGADDVVHNATRITYFMFRNCSKGKWYVNRFDNVVMLVGYPLD